MAEIKFYQDPAKEVQVYPEINPDGNYPGVTVGLADNLVSPDGQNTDEYFLFRSTGGTSINPSEGYANIKRLSGNTVSTTVSESLIVNVLGTGVTVASASSATFKSAVGSVSGTYNFIYTPVISYTSDLIYNLDKTIFANAFNKETGSYTFTYTPVIAQVDTSSVISTFNSATFVSKVNETPDTYTFNYDGSNWKLTDSTHEGTTITMSQYGITTTGSEVEGDSITIYYTSNSWYYNNAAVNMNTYGITTTGTEVSGNTITINYTSNQWQLNDSNVDLAEYGITITSGTPAIDDNIQIVYTAEQIGVIVVAKPTELRATGLNAFDYNNNVFNNFTIDEYGDIMPSTGQSVGFFRCLGNYTYTVFDGSSSAGITRVAFSTAKPTTSSTGMTILNQVTNIVIDGEDYVTATNTEYRKHYTASEEGWMAVTGPTALMEDLCCHLTWDKTYDDSYENFWTYDFGINYTDKDGNDALPYGLVKIDDTYVDEIDYENSKIYRRVERIEYSAENLAQIQAQTTHYIYDSEYIYYGIETITYNMPEITSNYPESDFGTEEFLGTALPVKASIFYQINLRDKLRNDVEVVSNKTDDVLNNADNTHYPSTLAIYELENMIWRMLGLHTTTFSTTKTYAVGEYVVYNHLLYKCITAVTTAGPWTGTNDVTWTDEDGVIEGVDVDTFYSWASGAYGSTNYDYRLTANGDHTYSIYALGSGQSTYTFSSDAELLASTGISPTNVAGEAHLFRSTGNWQESYLFTAE